MRLTMLPGFMLLLPLAEIAGFVIVGRAIGVLATLGLVVLGVVLVEDPLLHRAVGTAVRHLRRRRPEHPHRDNRDDTFCDDS